MGITIGVISIKGGVGKTSIAASLASELVNSFGKKVLLVDANYSAPNLSEHMDIDDYNRTIHDVLSGKARVASAVYQRYGVDVIPGRFNHDKKIDFLKLKDKLGIVKEDYDFIILDSSPSLNEEVLSTIIASDHLFVVTTPDYPTLSCSLRASRIAKQRGKNITGIIINKIREPAFEIKLEDIELLTGIPVIAKIKDDKNGVRSLYSRIPLSIYSPRSNFAKEVRGIAAALTKKREKGILWRLILPSHYNKELINRQLLKQSFYTSTFFGDNEKVKRK
jgi:MinD-like ATPase involved in chromosome partitioning or flagellar assembly